MSNKLACAFIALTLGLLVPLAFAPYSYPVVGIIALAVMLIVSAAYSRRFTAVLYFVFGLGMFGHGVWWIQISVHQFGLPLHSFSVTVTGLFVIAQALQLALFGYLTQPYLQSDGRFYDFLLVPACWTLIELFRSWLGTGFPWLLLGYAHVESPLAGYAPVCGVYGLSFVCAVIAVSVARLVSSRWRKTAAMIIFAAASGGYALQQIDWTHPTPDSVHEVALVQGAIPQGDKWRVEMRAPSIELYQQLSEPHWGKSLIVWPETAIPAFQNEVEDVIAALQLQASNSETAFLVGMPSRTVEESKSATDPPRERYYNSILQFGEQTGRYDKRHLVPFGEYMPFDRILRPITNLLHIPMSDFSAGQASLALMNGGKFNMGMSICYEDAYASLLRDSLPAAEVLINISNDAWFGDSIAPHQHLQISQMRALESGRYMLRATNTGISAIIDERGRIKARSAQFRPEVVHGNFFLYSGATPYVRFGDKPIVFLSFLLLASGWFLGRKSRSAF